RPRMFRLRLTATEGHGKGQSFGLCEHSTFLVGRSRFAHFQLPPADRYCSRIHFLVELNPPLCRVADLNSHNGTYVNGRRVESSPLADGDEIRAGRHSLRVSLEPLAPGAGPTTVDGMALGAEETETHAGRRPALPTLAEMPPLPGYTLERQLGKGGMGVVFAARREDGEAVAVKVVRPAVAGPRRQVERFLREARILQGLRHPRIVAFHEMG